MHIRLQRAALALFIAAPGIVIFYTRLAFVGAYICLAAEVVCVITHADLVELRERMWNNFSFPLFLSFAKPFSLFEQRMREEQKKIILR